MEMDHVEEQALEAEALESLFIEGELTVVEPNKKFLLSLLPSRCFHGGLGDKCYASVNLVVDFTASYPQQPPLWTLEDVRGLDGDQLKTLEEVVRSTMDANLGMPMVYEVAETITTFLTSHNRPPSSMHDQMIQHQAPKAVVDEDSDEDDSDYSPGESGDEESDDDRGGRRGKRREQEGEQPKGLADKDLVGEDMRCKHDEFMKWTELFRLEMIDKGMWKGSASLVASENKTGRQLFEMNSAEEGAAAGGPQTNVFWEDADLFEGGEIDVDDDDD
eukprot:GHVS01051625.1.p1 GENE.GHVS01051625.1~~GHVS01051625.1.p1  ORF type:complete len:275 (+),score=79.13 GHVS01051625.1:85-909(+)